MGLTDADLLKLIDKMRGTMVAVATGGPRIGDVNDEYQEQYRQMSEALRTRGVENPNPYSDLWQWYGKWNADIAGWAPRRAYIANMFEPLVASLRSGHVRPELTGWARVDRALTDAFAQLPRASAEEHFQSIGLMCREVLISVSQEVFVPERHPIEPGIKVSTTDFKRMIDAYLSVELAGGALEEARKTAKSALDLALRLQHQRTASFRDAAMCLEATRCVVNLVAIVSGKRDPTI